MSGAICFAEVATLDGVRLQFKQTDHIIGGEHDDLLLQCGGKLKTCRALSASWKLAATLRALADVHAVEQRRGTEDREVLEERRLDAAAERRALIDADVAEKPHAAAGHDVRPSIVIDVFDRNA